MGMSKIQHIGLRNFRLELDSRETKMSMRKDTGLRKSRVEINSTELGVPGS